MEKLIKDLQQIQQNLSLYTYGEIYFKLARLIQHVPIIITKSDKIPRISNGPYQDPSIIYRARPNESKNVNSTTEMPWTLITDISIVPEEKWNKIEFGRANKENQPRFYASNDWHVACYETIWHKFPLGTKEKDQNLTLGMWKIEEPLILAFIPFSRSYINRIRKHGQRIYEEIDTMIIDHDKQLDSLLLSQVSDKNKDKFLIEFFSTEFAKLEIKDKSDYFLSNFYCEQVFEKCPNEQGVNDIDGIIYPSVSFSYQYYNLVLHPRCLPKIRFIEAMYIWVNYFKDTQQMQYIPLEQHINADSAGHLIWNLFKTK